ncbi:hypothetical protein [Ferruginibacter sp. SUN106]|uniref:hypothetical protein n=1 Tax=Ferruginibacter sp. SUN106 TaxID=2978348 RepID=UPI003D366FD7
MIRNTLKYYYNKWYQKFHYDTFKNAMLTGKQLAEANKSKKNIAGLDDVAFQVFSQYGEDGIIQYIISQVEIPNPIFIEFGVEYYTESNTRFLLLNNNWQGLVIDGSKQNIRFIKQDFIYWKYTITACHSFITRENINALISNYTSCSDIGLLSIDIDGNDYWIWDVIEVVHPRIIICEYNATLGSTYKVSVPYAADFEQTKSHFSNIYYGASLAALCHLAEKKGYDFIGTASSGVNAFFVRKDLSAPFIKYTAAGGFHESVNRSSKNKKGQLDFLPAAEKLNVIKDMPVTDVVSGSLHTIKELYNL